MVAAGDIRPLYHAEGRRTLSRRTEDPGGDVAQLVERLLCKQDVRGSSPLVSIVTKSPVRRAFLLSGKRTCAGASDTISGVRAAPRTHGPLARQVCPAGH